MKSMNYRFYDLDWRQFELLCGSLLAAEGFSKVRQFGKPGAPDRGIDWVFETSDGHICIAQVKLFRRDVAPASSLRRAIVDLRHGLNLVRATKAILIVSARLAAKTKAELQRHNDIIVWDSDYLGTLIDKHPAIRSAYSALVTSAEGLEALLTERVEPARAGSDLVDRLKSVPAGKEGWREYEDACIDLLNYAFVPPLRPPKIQSSTEDGLDRRDAIYPIGMGSAFWDSIKYQYSSRMVVAEFKNYVDPIGQREVESLQQYLLPKAKRSFGLLCSRHEPSKAAMRARRRAWMVAENIILFLSDEDLSEITRIRSEDNDPSEVLDAQMDEFFIKLAP